MSKHDIPIMSLNEHDVEAAFFLADLLAADLLMNLRNAVVRPPAPSHHGTRSKNKSIST